MPGEHRPTSPSERPRVQARTRLARAAVVAAAYDLFAERGYGATTIDAISDTAGVPAATVYRLFASKSGILKALLDVAIVGDDDDVAMSERPHVRDLLAEADPRAQLAGFVDVVTTLNARVAPLHRILVSAAGSDPEAAALLDHLTDQRQRGQRVIARSLARAGALRREHRERDAADLIHALLSPELYRLLVIDRHWQPERYERWLAQSLVDQLLEPSSDRP